MIYSIFKNRNMKFKSFTCKKNQNSRIKKTKKIRFKKKKTRKRRRKKLKAKKIINYI